MKFGPMKKHRRTRLLQAGALVVLAAGAVSFALLALNENINLFYSPAQLLAGEAPTGRMIRAGGMVVPGSVERSPGGLAVQFTISDLMSSEVPVVYEGILPDLFREGQGVVARGRLGDDGFFAAEEVLAKHDENYMPPEVADLLVEMHQGQESYSHDLQAYQPPNPEIPANQSAVVYKQSLEQTDLADNEKAELTKERAGQQQVIPSKQQAESP